MPQSFRGGIRFPRSLHLIKETTLQSPLRIVTPPLIRLSLSHHTPCVNEGDVIRVGDCVAIDETGTIPPLHSGLSGIVTWEESSRLTVDGSVHRQLVVTGDGWQTRGALLPPLSDDASPSAIVQRMFDAGLVGLGGAGFPTFRKYRNHTAKHLLINACECEPYLASDGRLTIEQTDSVREGILWLAQACRAPSEGVILCAELPAVAAALRRAAEGMAWRVTLLPRRYPQGGEKQLIRAVLRRDIPAGSYPGDHGIIVSNVATAVAMADAARGLPLTHRTVTVSGKVQSPCNLLAPIGTPLRLLAAQAEPLITGRKAQLIAGGAMTGHRVASPDAGLPKACGGVLILPTIKDEESPCVRCGACVRACPSGLMPYLIDAAWLQNEDDFCVSLHPNACISCGCCSRVCPAQRHLAARITHIRRKGVTR